MTKVSRALDNLFYLAITEAGIPETDAEWRAWEEAQRAINSHLGEGHEGGRSEYDPSVWMMGQHAPSHEKFDQGDPADPDDNEAHPEPEEEWNGPVMCHDCACYHANGEGDPDHAEKYESGIARLGPNRHPELLCPEDGCEGESGSCVVCGDRVGGNYNPEGHRAGLFTTQGGGFHRVAVSSGGSHGSN